MAEDNPLDDPETVAKLIQQCLDLFFLPEVRKRQSEGQIEKPYNLAAAQIIFHPTEGQTVRLNDEVKFALDATLLDGSRTQNHRYNLADIAEIHAFRLTDVDADCGHATLFRRIEGWSLHFNFARYQDTCREYIEAASQFIASARTARDTEAWRVFIDNLFSACELAAKASLLWHADEQFIRKTNHNAISSRFNRYARSGNVPPEVREIFNTLRSSRSAARYIIGECSIDPVEADRWLASIQEFIESL